MNTATLEHATVTVQYVNPPKGNAVSGSIKDTNGDYYGVHKSALSKFAEGGRYEFDFSTNGAFRNVDTKTIQPLANGRAISTDASNYPSRNAAPRTQAQHAQQDVKRSPPIETGNNGNGNYYQRKSTDPKDAERMFVCSTLNAFISTGRINDDVTTLTRAVQDLRQVWADTFGQDDAAG